MFGAIASGDMLKLADLGRELSNREASSAAAFMCYDHVFSSPFSFDTASPANILSFLQSFSTYTRHLRQLALRHDPCNDTDLRKLLAFTEFDGGRYIIQPGTLLAAGRAETSPLAQTTDDQLRAEISSQDLSLTVRRVLEGRLLTRVRLENQAFRSSKVTSQPCLHFAVGAWCKNESCDWPHIAWDDLQAYYAERAHLVLTQVSIYDTVSKIEHWKNRREQTRYGYSIVSRFYHLTDMD